MMLRKTPYKPVHVRTLPLPFIKKVYTRYKIILINGPYKLDHLFECIRGQTNFEKTLRQMF